MGFHLARNNQIIRCVFLPELSEILQAKISITEIVVVDEIVRGKI